MALHLFFDESGDLSFGPRGSKFCLFGVLSTFDATALNEGLTALRYQILAEGTALERFHASEDLQAVRDRVFAALQTVGGFEFDVVVVDKRRTSEELRESQKFYPHFGGRLLERVFQRHSDPDQDVILITDTIPVKRHRKAVEKTFKQFVRRHLGSRPFAIHHHSSVAHPCLQAADYCTWAVYRKYQQADRRSYDLVQPFLRSESDVFEDLSEVI